MPAFLLPSLQESGVAKRKWQEPRKLSTLQTANCLVPKSLGTKNKEVSIRQVRGWGFDDTLRQRTWNPSYFSKHHFDLLRLLHFSLRASEMLVLNMNKMPWVGTLMTYSDENYRSYVSTLWGQSRMNINSGFQFLVYVRICGLILLSRLYSKRKLSAKWRAEGYVFLQESPCCT